MGEVLSGAAAFQAIFLDHRLIRVVDTDDRLQGGAEHGRTVFKDELLAGFDGDLVVIDVAGLGDCADQNCGGEDFDRFFGRVVGFSIAALTVVGLDQETAARGRAERSLEAEIDRTDVGIGADIELEGDFVARRERADIDGGDAPLDPRRTSAWSGSSLMRRMRA